MRYNISIAPPQFRNHLYDKFCAGSACHIWLIYDQSPHRNHLYIAAPNGESKRKTRP